MTEVRSGEKTGTLRKAVQDSIIIPLPPESDLPSVDRFAQGTRQVTLSFTVEFEDGTTFVREIVSPGPRAWALWT